MKDHVAEGYVSLTDNGISKMLLHQLTKLEEMSGPIDDGMLPAFCILAGPIARIKLEADIQIHSEETGSKILAHFVEFSDCYIGKYHVRIADMSYYSDILREVPDDDPRIYILPVREHPYILRVVTEEKANVILTEVKGEF